MPSTTTDGSDYGSRLARSLSSGRPEAGPVGLTGTTRMEFYVERCITGFSTRLLGFDEIVAVLISAMWVSA